MTEIPYTGGMAPRLAEFSDADPAFPLYRCTLGGAKFWARGVAPFHIRTVNPDTHVIVDSQSTPMRTGYLAGEPGTEAVWFRTEAEAQALADALNVAAGIRADERATG